LAVVDFIKNADLMWKQSVWTSAIASNVAAKHLKEGGIIVLTGAQAAIQGTPGMSFARVTTFSFCQCCVSWWLLDDLIVSIRFCGKKIRLSSFQ
jgi:hypothetical protein